MLRALQVSNSTSCLLNQRGQIQGALQQHQALGSPESPGEPGRAAPGVPGALSSPAGKGNALPSAHTSCI